MSLSVIQTALAVLTAFFFFFPRLPLLLVVVVLNNSLITSDDPGSIGAAEVETDLVLAETGVFTAEAESRVRLKVLKKVDY